MSQNQDQLLEYQDYIQQGLDAYQAAMKQKDLSAPSKLQKLNGYIGYYENHFADDEEAMTRLQRYKKQRDEIKKLGARGKNKQVLQGLNQQEQTVNKLISSINSDLDQGISIAEKVMAELDEQIDMLDKIYMQNKQIKSKLQRIKQSLLTLLRRICMDKLTCVLIILLILAIIALIVLNFTIKS